jgi:myosin V
MSNQIQGFKLKDLQTRQPIWIFENNDWKKGYLISEDENGYLVESRYVKHYTDKILIRNEDKLDCQNNLIDIPHLNEPTILNAVNIRFNNNNIYTYTGKILISVNPFKNLNLYSEESMSIYKTEEISFPHIYQIANNSFNNFINNQTILISGESGAGKTHATRSLMKYFAYISHKNSKVNIEDKVIQSNPILEAFGNAKTMRNDNSSRFGKFIKLEFNDNNVLTGAQIETYLLEKIRVINQSKKERNFHIFYQLLSNEIKEQYFLKDASNYKYLNNRYIFREDNVDDEDEYFVTLLALKTMGFLEEEIDQIFRIIASILHIGNIELQDNQIINSEETLELICTLLKINYKVLYSSLMYRYLEVQGEIIRIDLREDEIESAKNSLSMKLYQNLFSYIVQKINLNLNLNTGGNKFIGILDIFGFETFETNRYEQLCINYTNETLQQQFNKYIFKLEQIEYENEGIDWTHINFPDNQDCLNLLSGKLGLIEMLDEESRIPNGSSINFTKRFLRKYGNHKNLKLNKKYKDTCFSVVHYAGSVEYDTTFFHEKNKDSISNEIVTLTSKIKIFNSENIKRNKTVMIQFRKSLNDLMKIINTTSPHYIRCIKPNDLNKSDILDRHRVNAQLKYSGILEAVKVARAGYPIRFLAKNFDDKYSMIPNYKDLLPDNYFREGKTKIFLKMAGYEQLEKIRKTIIIQKVIILQKNSRMYLEKSRFNFIKTSIIKLQSLCRIIIAKHKLAHLRKVRNSIIIQKNTRCYLQKIRFKNLVRKINYIQLFYRNYKHKIITNACIKIQSKFRSIYYKYNYLSLLSKIKLIQKNFRIYLKQQSKVKKQNKKLKHKLEQQEKKLTELEVVAKKAKKAENRTKTELKTLEAGMKRSITEKIILSQRLEELMIENDRIRKMKTNSLSECILM